MFINKDENVHRFAPRGEVLESEREKGKRERKERKEREKEKRERKERNIFMEMTVFC